MPDRLSFGALLLARQPVHVGLVGQQFPHLIAGFAVFPVGFFFCSSSAAYSACKLLTVGSFFIPSSSKAALAA